MFWDDGKKKPNEKKEGIMTRLFQACLLLLGCVIALAIAVHLLAQFWGWLVLLVAIALLIGAGVWVARWWRDRRW
ncbi:hypothetical protein [Microbacterium candidum]|uniref:Uncharacterized protein n=1 Tax=Microbacterium candidum TaxID=3041922 RepID=A0ABT7N065_9MICO|nr:hypothetical protein [Microbacterium sp. ASV49]MDL9980098.1 hypothetical protein [Microbacterium sp. ASV49]